MMTAADPNEGQLKAGATLRQLRSKKNLSVQEIAGQMRLDPKIVEALESDNYGIFPADTYIRGYLRNYAKLLGVKGDEIISLYQSEALAPPEIIPDIKHPTQVTSSDKPVKIFSYLITFILVLLLFIWWRQSNFSFLDSIRVTAIPAPVVTAPAIETESTPTDIPTEILAAMPANSSTSDVMVTSQSTVPPTVAPIVYDTGSPIPTVVVAATDPAAEVTAADTSAIPAAELTAIDTPVVPPGEVTATDTPAVPAAETDSENRAVPGPDTIYLKLNADCWIDIRDQFDKEVYQNLARTGEEIRLSGYAPFQVELGNAQGVILEFNDKPYDPAPVTTRGIARFTLGN